jgi:hypothetical protein
MNPRHLRLASFVIAGSALLAGGCARPVVSVEVLPPRTSATCSAPAANSAAWGQGLFDVTTTLGAHGSYLADLRVSATGVDVRVDGFRVAYSIPSGSTVTAASHDRDLVVGDVLLDGEKDDLRVGIVENVELVSRDMAVEFQGDDGLEADKIDFASLGLTITPIVLAGDVDAAPTTFGIELCRGCLTTPPDVCAGAGQYNATPVVCRPGQDVPAFVCNPAAVVLP